MKYSTQSGSLEQSMTITKINVHCILKLTKNANPDKYSYSGYGIRFDSRSLSLIRNFDFGKKCFGYLM